ncbi:unnamed protein product [Porites evermanni]|uniref:Uncharacterized protein n=1 Tax=Porites evermanni TaxID=104178 RepID=A0ABN8MP00_9CNID|nr:unnamed protein product [Porites evermanni]
MDSTLRSPLEDASFFSRLTFWWVNGLFSKGYDRRLEPGDMYDVLPEDSAERLVSDLESEWYKEIAAATFSSRQPSFGNAMGRFAKMQLIIVGIFGFLNETIRTAQPVILFYLVSYFTSGSSITKLEAYIFATGLTLSSMLSIVLHQLYFFYGHRTGMHMRIATTGCIYRKVLRLASQGLYSSVSTNQQAVNLITTDTQIFDQLVTHLHFVWITPIQVVVVVYFLWIQLGFSCAVGIVLTLILIIHQAWFNRKYSKLSLNMSRLTEERCKRMNEIIKGMKVVKIFTWEFIFSELINSIRRLEMSRIHKTQCLQAFNMATGFVSQSIITCTMFITYVLLGNPVNAAKVFSSVAMVTVLQRSLARHFLSAVQKLNEARKTATKIQTFLKLDELNFENIKHRSTPRPGHSSVAVSNVTCTWNNQESIGKATLQDVSFEVKQGDLCMIVGPVGSGKSSLLMMLLGEMRVIEGHLCIRGKIGFVPQQAWIFSGSVRQNIIFGQTFEEDRYHKVIRACALEQDVDLLPEGDWTLIGEKGIELSDGQKARLCLARAVYYKADIYILDDPLSAVDVRVGRKLFDQCINGLIRDCPRILVTRQLQYLRNATEILFIDQGTIHSRGSYTDLANSGIDLVSLLRSRDSSKNDDDDDNDSAIDEDSEPAQTPHLPGVILRKGKWAKGIKAVNRWSTTSSIDIEADFEAMANKVLSHNTYWLCNRRHGCERHAKKVGNFYFLCLLLVSCTSVQQEIGAFIFSDWWLSQWSSHQSEDTFLYKSVHTALSSNRKLQNRVHVIIYGGLVAVTIILSLIRAFVFFNITVNSSKTLHRQLFDAVIRAPLYFFDTNPPGRIHSHFSSDTAYMDIRIPETLFDFLQLALLAGAVVVVNLIAMPFMSIGLLPLVVIFYCLRNYYLKTSSEIKRLETSARSPILSQLNTTLQGLTSIRAHSLQQLMIHEFDICQDHHTQTWFLFIATSRWFAYRLDFLCTIFVFMSSFTPLFITERGEMEAGMVGLCVTYALLLTGMFQWCVRQSGEVGNQMTAVERILDLCQLESEGECDREVAVPGFLPELGLITAEGVSFKYHPTLPRVLRNLNFCIRPKEKVGIVGDAGAGKSSLLAALLRFVEPHQGTIRIDGVDITEISLYDLRSRLSFIPENPVLFGETLRKHLDPNGEFCDADLWLALHQVHLRDIVCSVIGSLDSPMTPSGCTLNVGQRQLVYLARAILKNNRIVVLETADLDHRTDTMIQETIRSKFKNCTVLISANRLQAVIDCDRVMVLDNGQLKEFEEPHLLLLNRLSFFSRLVEKTGTINALQLRKAARKAYELRHDSENTLDIIPDSVRSFLSSYIPVSGYTDLQLVSYV